VYDIPSLLYTNEGIGDLLLKLEIMSPASYQQLKDQLYDFRKENVRSGLMYIGEAISIFNSPEAKEALETNTTTLKEV